MTGPVALSAARFPNTAATDFLLEVGEPVSTDGKNIRAAALAYGTPLEEYPGQKLGSVAYGYPPFINWICLQGSAAAIALVAYVNISLWHEACAILTPALRKHPGVPEEVMAYFAAYEERPTDILDKALAIVADETKAGHSVQQASDTGRLMEKHLAAFWQPAAQ
ncbi:hypothetical protein ACFYVL_00265 [Streptomyces sp. NPDC004111]|uniref:hypothetical protein n=1 Tax=Streptomyces sp. NPDC004111 TaxID=3364690 RepID=UPI0036A4240D